MGAGRRSRPRMPLLLACVSPPGSPGRVDTAESDMVDTGESVETGDTAPTSRARAVWVWQPAWDDPEPFADALVEGGFTTAGPAGREPDATHDALIAA